MFVKTIDVGLIDDCFLKYVVICVRFHNKWVFSRHKMRNTWELPGGHIEPGETAIIAAQRELFEETGIKSNNIYALCDYYAEQSLSNYAYGRLYYCHTNSITKPPSEYEMAEVGLFDEIPENLTHKVIHSHLYFVANQHIKR